MRARSFFSFVFALCAIAPGCRTTYPEGVYDCTPAMEATLCPPGWYCHSDLKCWSRIEMPDAAMVDGGMRDTGTDAPTRDTGVDAPEDAPIVLPDGCVLGTYYRDVDGDHYGVTAMAMQACSAPTGYVSDGGDCNDGDLAIHPGATEICNGLDEDCSGTADDSGGLECVMGMPTSCTTTCGSSGTGLCTTTCLRPTGASCSPPAETCNGLDDNCDGRADEMLTTSVGPSQVAFAHGSVGQATVELVATTSGYQAFALYDRLWMRPLGADGLPVGSSIPLDSSIVSDGGGAEFGVRATGDDFLVALAEPTSMTARVTVARVNETGGTIFVSHIPNPAGVSSYGRTLISESDGTVARVYATYASVSTSPRTYSIRRYDLNVSGATASVLSGVDIVTNLTIVPVYAVASTAASEFVVYVDSAGNVQLISVSSVGAVTPVGTIASATMSTRGVAIAATDRSMPTAVANPLGVAWMDSASVTGAAIRFAEVTGIAPFAMGTSSVLPGSAGANSTYGRPLTVVAAPNDSAAPRASHWFIAAAATPPTGPFREQAWELFGSTTIVETIPMPLGANYGMMTLVSGDNGARMAYVERNLGDIVSRAVGCQ